MVEMLDMYHAREHCWQFAEACFGDRSPTARAWVEPLSARLETEGPEPVQAAMAVWMAAAPRDRETAQKEPTYFTHHAHRMHDPDSRRLGVPLGSGGIEGA
jgi:hypothetical protein